jgi:hypothetical protein
MLKKPNPIAKNLSNRLFSSKVVHSKKLYNRKKGEKIPLSKRPLTKENNMVKKKPIKAVLGILAANKLLKKLSRS